MNRSTSPIHVHVGKKTPVHLHLSSSGRSKKHVSEAKIQKFSSSEMSAGRPSLRASRSISPTRSSRLRASHWVNASSSKGPWIPPPAKASKTRLSWEGPTHRLEINPVGVDPSQGSTVLHMSDLNSEEGSTDIILQQEDSYSKKVSSLAAEVEHLKTEADLHRSLRSLEGKELQLQESRASLRDKEVELDSCREDLLESELENAKLRTSIARLSPPRPSSRVSGVGIGLDDVELQQRDRLLKKLVEMEMDSTEVSRQANSLRDAIRKLQRERRFSSVYAADVAEQKDLLLERLAQFESSNKTLRKMIRAHQSTESSKSNLQAKLTEAESTNQLLRFRLDEQEKLAAHSQSLHDEIGMKEGEMQSLSIRLQSKEEQLRLREERCLELESELAEVKRKGQREKEMLKRATKQHKSQAAQSEHTVETIGAQLEDVNAELEHTRSKLTKSTREQISQQAEIRTLTVKVADLEEALTQSKQAHRNSLDTVSAKLSDKTHELNSSQLESDQLRAVIASLEGRAKVAETTGQSKLAAIEAEIAQLKATLNQHETMASEYKSRLERSRNERDELSNELRKKEQEVERVHQDKIIELEKCHLKYQHQISELESIRDQLKATEIRLQDAQERLVAYDQRSSEQTKLIAELTAKAEHHSEAMEGLREKWHGSSAENRALSTRVESTDRRLRELEEQNRDLMTISGKKEENAQRLQNRVEDLVQEVSSLTTQLETSRSDSKRQSEHLKDRAASKDRANLSRIADLESQLSRANTLATQFRKAKEDADRRYHSRIHELQERLDQANATKKSMENYVNFLKSSYANVFNDSGTPGSPLPTFKI